MQRAGGERRGGGALVAAMIGQVTYLGLVLSLAVNISFGKSQYKRSETRVLESAGILITLST